MSWLCVWPRGIRPGTSVELPKYCSTGFPRFTTVPTHSFGPFLDVHSMMDYKSLLGDRVVFQLPLGGVWELYRVQRADSKGIAIGQCLW